MVVLVGGKDPGFGSVWFYQKDPEILETDLPKKANSEIALSIQLLIIGFRNLVDI